MAPSKWLLERWLQLEQAYRTVRSVNHQMNMAELPMHLDLAGFDFRSSSSDARLVNFNSKIPQSRVSGPFHEYSKARPSMSWLGSRLRRV